MEFDPDSLVFNARYDLFQLLVNHFNVIACLYPRLFAVSVARISAQRQNKKKVKIFTLQREALAYFEQQPEPVVVIICQRLEDGSGLDLLQQLKAHARSPQCLLLLLNDHAAIVEEAQQLGADAIFLESSLGNGEINLAVECLIQGKTYIDSRLQAIADYRKAQKDELTQREVMILRLVAEGKTNSEIGQELHLASSTVREYVQTIMRKLNARDRTSAAIAGLREGYLT
jgi:DNA-binding NarL/FixJ family response regulator